MHAKRPKFCKLQPTHNNYCSRPKPNATKQRNKKIILNNKVRLESINYSLNIIYNVKHTPIEIHVFEVVRGGWTAFWDHGRPNALFVPRG